MRALFLNQNADKKIEGQIQPLTKDILPHYGDQDVVVKISHSTLNFKDAMVLKGIGRLVKNYPHIPGVDFAGTVMDSNHPRYKVGDAVILTGWRVGEFHWGGLADMARIDGDWLVPAPKGFDGLMAMSVGTAGFTAALAIHRLMQAGLDAKKTDLPVLVTGATGGVGSFAVSLLKKAGFKVAAVTGKKSAYDYLTSLGADHIIAREELNEVSTRPLEKESWSAAIDAVGGVMLGRVLAQTQYGGSVASIGLAGGNELSGTVLPFLLRGVSLIGIDSVLCPYDERVACWEILAKSMSSDELHQIGQEIRLEEALNYASPILKGEIQGRIIVNMAK